MIEEVERKEATQEEEVRRMIKFDPVDPHYKQHLEA